jgi:hypothetical protein
MGLMSLRVRIARVVVLAGVLGLLSGVLPALASAESCPNEEIRAEQGSERLPDCRAFELVTPEIKGDISTIAAAYGFPDGNHVYFRSILPVPGARNGGVENALSTRAPTGWTTTPLTPPAGKGEPISLTQSIGGNDDADAAFTGDFSAAFVNSGFATDPLDEDSAIDAYRVDLPTGEWSLAALPDSGPLTSSTNPMGTFIVGVSENGSNVLFQTYSKLSTAPDTPADIYPEGPPHLYDRAGGHTYLVGVLPNGSPAECSVIGDGGDGPSGQKFFFYGAVSPDGSNVVFEEAGESSSPGCQNEVQAVYLREKNATTVQLTGSIYAGRSTDGSKIFTEGVGSEEANGVYEYDVASGTTTTVSPEGWFVAASADGSHVYYWIKNGANAGLYLWEDGGSTLIPGAGAGFASAARQSRGEFTERDMAVATPDGSRLLFLDTSDLTGYDSFGATEAYVYDASTGSITCVSCNPTGAPPLGNTNFLDEGHQFTNGLIPSYSEGEISPDGSRVFFETEDALVPQDTNGLKDVYEWENGRIYLISSGQGTRGSFFSGASSNGNDVFITTTDDLAPQDIESSVQIYDARIDGGFPYKPFTSGCNSGECQGPQTPAPSFGPPASATFVGLGNPVEVAAPPTVKTKLKAKPKRKPKKKQRKKKAGKTARRPSGVNGRHKSGATNGKRKESK